MKTFAVSDMVPHEKEVRTDGTRRYQLFNSSPTEVFFKRSHGHIHIIDMAVQENNDFIKTITYVEK